MNVAKLVSQRRDTLSMAVPSSGCSGFGNSLTGQGKRHVERGRCSAVDNVGTDSQPIRRQIRISDPGLQIGRQRRARNGPWARQVQEIPAGQQNLWAEEIMTGRQNDRARERDCDLHLVACE